MRIKYPKLIIILVTFLIINSSALLASPLLSDLSFTKKNNKVIQLTIVSNEKFEYFISAKDDDFIVDFKGVEISDDLLHKINRSKSVSDVIKKFKVEKISDDIQRLYITFKNPKQYRFLVNAPSGVLFPYGFNVSNSKQNFKQEKRLLEDQLEDVDSIDEILEKNLVISSNKKMLLNNNRLSEDQIVDVNDYQRGITDDLVIETTEFEPNSVSLTQNNAIKDTEAKPVPVQELVKRLTASGDEDIEFPRLSSSLDEKNSDYEDYELRVTEKNSDLEKSIPEYIKNTLNTEKQISSKDIKSLNNKPPILKAPIHSLSPKEKNKKTEAISLKPQIDSSSLKEKKQTFSSQQKQVLQEILSGMKTIPTGNVDNNLSENTNSLGQNIADNSDYFKLRALSFIPIGLFEQQEELQEELNDQSDNLQPKPNMSSDGSLLFKVYSSDGVSNGQAPIVKVKKIDLKPIQIRKPEDKNLSITPNALDYPFKRMMTKAKLLQENGNLQEAELIYKDIIKQYPDQPWGYVAIAGFYEFVGKNYEAINAYNVALRSLQQHEEILYNFALHHYYSGNMDLAIQTLQKLLSFAPDYTLAYYALGNMYYLQQDLDMSINCYNKAIKLNPLLIDAMYNLGLSYIIKKDAKRASEYFEKILVIDSSDIQSQYFQTKLSQIK